MDSTGLNFVLISPHGADTRLCERSDNPEGQPSCCYYGGFFAVRLAILSLTLPLCSLAVFTYVVRSAFPIPSLL